MRIPVRTGTNLHKNNPPETVVARMICLQCLCKMFMRTVTAHNGKHEAGDRYLDARCPDASDVLVTRKD